MKYPLCTLIASLFFSPVTSSEQPLSTENLLLKTYVSQDFARTPAFQGGYINFGYWKGITPKEEGLTRADRIKASEALYDLVISHLKIQSDDTILEIGSGRGNGCVKIAKKLKPAFITGIDIAPQQIAHAKKIHRFFLQKTPSVVFVVGSSEALPLDNESCTKIFSVEAAQCFPSMATFAKEAARVLKPGGRLVIAAHFATGEKGYAALKKLIPTVEQGADRLIPIQDVRAAFAQSNFKEISFENIGEFVFEGFNQWRSSVTDVTWANSVIQAYKEGHMGYYLLVLEK